MKLKKTVKIYRKLFWDKSKDKNLNSKKRDTRNKTIKITLIFGKKHLKKEDFNNLIDANERNDKI